MNNFENPYFIAEIGINHNGSLEMAFKLIDIAKRCGCDAVKFQKEDLKIVYKESFLKEKEKALGVQLNLIKKKA